MNGTAIRLELTAQEAAHLRDLLDVAVSDLSPEIAGTDNAEYRAGLRDRRESLRSVRSKLGS
jgi:hypothetical protein